MLIRSFSNGYEVQDYTPEINVIPNVWGTLGQMGIFEEIPVSQHVVVFEEIDWTTGVITDRVRGERSNQNGAEARKLHTFAVPHFPLDDYISPQDLQGQGAYATANGTVDTLDMVRARKLKRLRQAHANGLEIARAQLITAGTVYAPNGTVTQDWNAEFGVTRQSVDMTFGTSTTDQVANIEAGISYIQDHLLGASMTGTVMLCSPEFFAKFISHASVKTAYQYYQQTQTPLGQQRLGGSSTRHRQFEWAGTTLIEMRDTINGTRLIPAGNAYMIPLGTDAFRTYFSPANRFGLVNTLGEQVYVFETQDVKGTKIEIESESNFVNACVRPQLIVNFSSSN